MAHKQRKKRQKKYQGADAAVAAPTITRISAVHRSKPAQWWFDHKRIAKPILITAGVVTALLVLIFETIRIASL